ncbi:MULTISPECIES: hypothetical protein [unclassified Roseovarius]|uniref:hypothetical protein n=1 Tax=unclassified Roseovarius TaxID=2614913 RepID=UPI001561F433|nr:MULTISPECIES: hypothetical protein [unclassified Roseovarius]
MFVLAGKILMYEEDFHAIACAFFPAYSGGAEFCKIPRRKIRIFRPDFLQEIGYA